ncbi:MAG: hypothetical protein K2G12_06875 [Prevotella sp.]|nr:hypothetical protein [Prevotella sp.]
MIRKTAVKYKIGYVPLEDYGINSVAFTLEDAIRILDIMEKELVPILGGDIYVLDGAELRPTYQNWSCERIDGQDMASFVHDSCTYARKYIKDIKKQFVVVPSKWLLVELVSFI